MAKAFWLLGSLGEAFFLLVIPRRKARERGETLGCHRSEMGWARRGGVGPGRTMIFGRQKRRPGTGMGPWRINCGRLTGGKADAGWHEIFMCKGSKKRHPRLRRILGMAKYYHLKAMTVTITGPVGCACARPRSGMGLPHSRDQGRRDTKSDFVSLSRGRALTCERRERTGLARSGGVGGR